MVLGNSLRQTVHTHRASLHQAAKLLAALLRIVGVTAGLAESNGSLPPGLWLRSPAGWLPRTGISSGTLRSAIECRLSLRFFTLQHSQLQIFQLQLFGKLWSSHLPSQVECLQYNNRLHMTVCFISFSRHSIIVDTARSTWLIILTQHSKQITSPDNC